MKKWLSGLAASIVVAGLGGTGSFLVERWQSLETRNDEATERIASLEGRVEALIIVLSRQSPASLIDTDPVVDDIGVEEELAPEIPEEQFRDEVQRAYEHVLEQRQAP